MDKLINESFIKFSSRVPFPGNLGLGDDLEVSVDKGEVKYIFNVVKSEDRDNQDGTIDRIYTLKSLSE